MAQRSFPLPTANQSGGGGPGGSSLVATFAYSASNTYTLPTPPPDPANTLVFVNGAKQLYGADYNFTGPVLNWVSVDLILSNGDTIEVYQ